MTERAIEAYMQTLQSGFAGLALMLAIAIVLLTIAAIQLLRHTSKQDTSNQVINRQAQQNIHDLIELQKGQQTILAGTEASLKINNELKQKQTDAFIAQENQLKAIHTSLQEWPKAYTSAVQVLTQSVNDLRTDIETALKQGANDRATMHELVTKLDSKIDKLLSQVTELLLRSEPEPVPAMPLALQPDKPEDKGVTPE